MEANGLLDGVGGVVAGRLEGTDLEVAYDLQREDLVLRVNKGGVLVFRAMLRDAAKDIGGEELTRFNSFAPDMVFRIGDSEEGLTRMLAVSGEPVIPSGVMADSCCGPAIPSGSHS
jgi:hypothetical protein